MRQGRVRKMDRHRSYCAALYFWSCFFILLSAAIMAINYWIDNKSYVFDHEELEKLAMNYKGEALEASFEHLLKDVKKRYSPHILDVRLKDFFLMNAGGWMGQVCALHASLTEYILIFHTAQETSGHSGRYWLNITDFVVTGWMEQWPEGTFQAKNFTAGVTVHHPWLTSAGVRFGANSWFLEYGRGFVPSSMFFASADVFFSTHDFVSWFAMLKAFGTGLLREAYITFGEVMSNFQAQ